jgi:hypothetical protein
MSVLNLLIPVVSSVLDRVLPGDSNEIKVKRLEIENELQKALVQENVAQIEVNKNEASSTNLFVSGWRPFIGWVCGLSLAYPLFKIFADWWCTSHGMPSLPSINNTELQTILYGMLGLGGMRTYEKIKGVNSR